MKNEDDIYYRHDRSSGIRYPRSYWRNRYEENHRRLYGTGDPSIKDILSIVQPEGSNEK
jgi:hypothetical protein